MKKFVKVVLSLVVVLGISVGGVNGFVSASTKYVSQNTYAIHKQKTQNAESLLDYDFGSRLPHDDAYIKGYSQGISNNYVYVLLRSPDGRQAVHSYRAYNETIYRVAEIGGVDFARYAEGVSTSKMGTLRMHVK